MKITINCSDGRVRQFEGLQAVVLKMLIDGLSVWATATDLDSGPSDPLAHSAVDLLERQIPLKSEYVSIVIRGEDITLIRFYLSESAGDEITIIDVEEG